MNESEALGRMVAPGTRRPGKWRGGVIQIWVTRACDKACFGCTQGSNLEPLPVTAYSPAGAGRGVAVAEKTSYGYITPAQFETAVKSLAGYWGVVGVFGGNPAMHPQFEELCHILSRRVPREQRGLWCNNPLTAAKATAMRRTFNPAVSNLNVHLDAKAFALFRAYWPEAMPFGLNQDSRHSPPFVAMRDLLRKPCPRCLLEAQAGLEDDGGSACPTCSGTGSVYDEERAWDLIAGCDINQHWSAMIGVFRGEVRAWFCEIAGAQAMLHQHEPGYPDTGLPIGDDGLSPDPLGDYTIRPDSGEVVVTREGPTPARWEGRKPWWQLPMEAFRAQVRKHCHDCGVPLRAKGSLALDADGTEQVTATHESVYRPKKAGRRLSLVTVESDLGPRVGKTTDYLGNAKR